MSKSVLFIRKKKENDCRVVINAIQDWGGFEKLVKYLQMHYKVKILESYDGPDARRWIIQLNDEKIELIHSDGYGNYLKACNEKGEDLITSIGEDLEARLKNI